MYSDLDIDLIRASLAAHGGNSTKVGEELAPRLGSGGRKKRNVYPLIHQPICQKRHDPIPGPIMPGRGAPCYGRQHCDTHLRKRLLVGLS